MGMSVQGALARLIDLFGPQASWDPTKLYGNLMVSPSGNIVVGASADDGSGYKLQVTGGLKLENDGIKYADGSIQSGAAGLVFLGSGSASAAANIAITGLMSSAYENYRLILSDFYASNESYTGIELSINDGASWLVNEYFYTGSNQTPGNASTATANNLGVGYAGTFASMPFNFSQNTGQDTSVYTSAGVIELIGMSNSSGARHLQSNFSTFTSAGIVRDNMAAACYGVTSPITAINIINPTGGTVTTKWALYGYRAQ